MALYDSQITIFNYDSKTKGFKSELITQVECQKWYESNAEVGYTENFDSMLVLVKFSMVVINIQNATLLCGMRQLEINVQSVRSYWSNVRAKMVIEFYVQIANVIIS